MSTVCHGLGLTLVRLSVTREGRAALVGCRSLGILSMLHSCPRRSEMHCSIRMELTSQNSAVVSARHS